MSFRGNSALPSLLAQCLNGRDDNSSEDESSHQYAASTTGCYSTERELTRFPAGMVEDPPMEENCPPFDGGPPFEGDQPMDGDPPMLAAPPVVAAHPVMRAHPVVAAPPVVAVPVVMGGPPMMPPRCMPPRRMFPPGLNVLDDMLESKDIVQHPKSRFTPPKMEGMEGSVKDITFEVVCPPGFEVFMTMDKIIVDQMIAIPVNNPIFNGIVSTNNYKICRNDGMPLFYVLEYDASEHPAYNKSCCLRCVDIAGRELCVLKRRREPLEGGCCDEKKTVTAVYLNIAEVYIGGTTDYYESLDVRDGSGTYAMKILWPGTIRRIKVENCDLAFSIVDKNDKHVGTITKLWGGEKKEKNVGADTYSVNVPVTLHPQYKVLLMFSAIMIDYRFFEGKRK